MSRWQASAMHFAISLMVFLVLLAIILLIWYPGILFSVDGGWSGLRIVIGVDLVLGPLLTLIVFKSGKPGLKFDLGCIAVVQISCLTAGMWIVYNERPLALVLAYDTFYSVTAQEFDQFGKDTAVLDDIAGPYPKLIYVELPDNEVAAGIANIRSLFIGDPLYIQTEKYRALISAMPDDAVDLAAVFRQDIAVRSMVSDELLAELQGDCLLSEFISGVTSGYVCYDSETQALSRFFDSQYVKQVESETIVEGGDSV